MRLFVVSFEFSFYTYFFLPLEQRACGHEVRGFFSLKLWSRSRERARAASVIIVIPMRRTLDHTLFVITYIVPVFNTYCLYYINVDNGLLCNEFLLATTKRIV